MGNQCAKLFEETCLPSGPSKSPVVPARQHVDWSSLQEEKMSSVLHARPFLSFIDEDAAEAPNFAKYYRDRPRSQRSRTKIPSRPTIASHFHRRPMAL